MTSNYIYNSALFRPTSADYSTGDSYHYAYDSVGNRLTQDSSVHGREPALSGGEVSSVSYNYDIANRLADMDGVPYVYDANGNLLNDGVNTYAYDAANRLTSVLGSSSSSQYTYNGLGDRLSQDGIQYTLDLNSGLTQVLDDGTNTYSYGLGRISQQGESKTEYFLGDALGSVRQLTSQSGQVTYSQNYDPYGVVTQSSGAGQSEYGYTGEQQDGDMVYLRSRYYNVADGRFQSRDTWGGDVNRPMSMNRWGYVEGNPINLVDPSGNIPTQHEVYTGRQVYSCNCGWIDFGHAGSRLALSIINLLDKEKEFFPLTHYSPIIRGDAFAITPSATISIWNAYDQTVSLTAVVQTGLDKQTKDSVALGIFRSLEEKIEDTQGDNGMWFTSYSFEDLTSDEIGFYLAREFEKVVNPVNNDKAWNYLANKCGFPQNRQEAIERSLKVYDSMNIDSLWGDPFTRLMIDTPHVYSWASPLLCELNGLCDDEPKQWPVEFTSVVPILPSRNHFWWFYDRNLDGRLLDPNSEFSRIHR